MMANAMVSLFYQRSCAAQPYNWLLTGSTVERIARTSDWSYPAALVTVTRIEWYPGCADRRDGSLSPSR